MGFQSAFLPPDEKGALLERVEMEMGRSASSFYTLQSKRPRPAGSPDGGSFASKGLR